MNSGRACNWIVLRAVLGILLVAGTKYSVGQQRTDSLYLYEIKEELRKKWPENRTVNLVFHGHSVPAGYFKTPEVNTMDSYPYQLLVLLKKKYPHAVINVINTSIGGENSKEGASRLREEVLNHHPDVLFIDYGLNDRRIGLAESYSSWSSMIRKAQSLGIKVILLTPTPDQRVDILNTQNGLEQHRQQILKLASEYGTGLIDSYTHFRIEISKGTPLPDLMSQVNHPNTAGHALVAKAIAELF